MGHRLTFLTLLVILLTPSMPAYGVVSDLFRCYIRVSSNEVQSEFSPIMVSPRAGTPPFITGRFTAPFFLKQEGKVISAGTIDLYYEFKYLSNETIQQVTCPSLSLAYADNAKDILSGKECEITTTQLVNGTPQFKPNVDLSQKINAYGIELFGECAYLKSIRLPASTQLTGDNATIYQRRK